MEELLKKRTKNIAIMVWKNCQNTGNEFKDYKNQLIDVQVRWALTIEQLVELNQEEIF